MKDYIKYILPTTIMLFFTLIIFYIGFYLTNIDIDIYIMSLQLTILVYVFYLAISALIYKRKRKASKEVLELLEENKRVVEEGIAFKNNLLEYFLMWIHQIKTPITSSYLVIECMEDGQNKKFLSQSMFQIDRYTNMALDYLKLSEHDSSLDVSTVDLDDCIKDILKRYSFLFINNGIKLEYSSVDKCVITDNKWLSIMIEQILSNAIKYTPKGSVSIYFDDEKNALCIKDTGMGIREEDIPRIFNRGYSGFNGRYSEKSSGIGLYIVKRIADRINVDVSLDSKIGEGSIFYIEFKK